MVQQSNFPAATYMYVHVVLARHAALEGDHVEKSRANQVREWGTHTYILAVRRA